MRAMQGRPNPRGPEPVGRQIEPAGRQIDPAWCQATSATVGGGDPPGVRAGETPMSAVEGRGPKRAGRGSAQDQGTQAAAGATVVYLAAPNLGERYYGRFVPRFADELARLYVRLGEALQPDDRMVVLAPYARLARLARLVPPTHLREWTMADVWVRDVAPVRTPLGWVKSRYRPSYCPTAQAEYIDERCRRWYRRLGLRPRRLDLVLDGGNVVSDGRSQVVITEQVVRDNPRWSRDSIRRLIIDKMGFWQVCLLPVEPGDPTGHADGAVLWLSPTQLAVSRLTGLHGREVRRRLREAFPKVELIEVPYEPEGTGATGIYVNALTTRRTLYVPTYGRRSDDEALRVLEEHSPRGVVPVEMGPIGAMGGSLRCLTWEMPGPPPHTGVGTRGTTERVDEEPQADSPSMPGTTGHP